jgi:hypothetical protein
MLERFTVLRRVKVNNTMNAFDIKASCRNISRYNSMSFTLAEIINSSRTHFLGHSSMYASYTESFILHFFSHTVYARSCTAENETTARLSNRFSTNFTFHRVRH